jgi:hypothetical protein
MARIDEIYRANGKPLVSENAPRRRELENQIAAMAPAQINEVKTRVNQYFADLLAFKNVPAAQRLGREPSPQTIRDGSFYSDIPGILMPNISSLAETQAFDAVRLRVGECLVALKLWKSRKNELPPDLAVVTKAAGLPGVPLDPYSGQPLRMALVDGQPVVYSVGKDGRDDGGRVDSDWDHKPGDHVFRLPAIEPGRR